MDHSFSNKQFKKHLIKLGIKKGDSICIHSRLISFGRLKGNISEIFNIIKNTIGVNGTIAVPAFTFNLKENDIYDPKLSKPYNMGALTNFVFSLKNIQRTSNPINSYILYGKKKDICKKVNNNKCFGKDSIFDVLNKNNFKLLLLGCNYQEGGTFIHHVEYLVNAYYRKKLILNRKIKILNKIKTHEFEYFARKDYNIKTNLLYFEKILLNDNVGNFEKIENSNRLSHLISLKILKNYSINIYNNNNKIFLEK